MRRVAVQELETGAILARPVCNERGQLLLNAGMPLQRRHVRFLTEHGYNFVFVEEEIPPDLNVSDLLRERVRLRITPSWYRVFSTTEYASYETSPAVPNDLIQEMNPANVPPGATDPAGYDSFCESVEFVLERAMTREVLHAILGLRELDSFSFLHSIDVAATATMIGKRLFFGLDALIMLARGCLLHDIGMLNVDRNIVMKPGPPTPDEWKKLRAHPTHGYEMVKTLPGTSAIEHHVVYQHHERQDGSGYPRGLSGTNLIARRQVARRESGRILLAAEICAVADVFDALSSERPHRTTFGPDSVVRTLRSLAGTILNREVVQQFLAIVPVYSLGTEVILNGGRFNRFRGIVCGQFPNRPDKPIVRLLFDDQRRRIAPIDYDVGRSDAIVVPYQGASGVEADARN